MADIFLPILFGAIGSITTAVTMILYGRRLMFRARYSGYTFTFEPRQGIQFHYHPAGDRNARGCRLWYFDADYDDAFPPDTHIKTAAQVAAEMRVMDADGAVTPTAPITRLDKD